MSDAVTCSKVIAHRQTLKAHQIQEDTDGISCISMMFCTATTDVLLPPFVTYKPKRLFSDWCVGGPPGTGFENSDKFQ